MSKIIRHSVIFGTGNIISRSIAILLVPLYTRNMTVTEFGIFSAGLTLYAVLNIIMRGGAPAAMLKLYVEDRESRGEVVFMTYLYTLIIAAVTAAVSVLLSGNLFKLLIGADGLLTYLIIIGSAFAEAMIEVPLNVFRAKEQSKLFAVFSVIGSILTLVLSFLFISVMKMRINGAFLAMLLAKGIVFTASSIFLLRDFSWSFNKKISNEIMQIGTPIVVSGLSLWLVNMSDRLIITSIRGGYEAGLYSLGNRIGTMLNILILTPFSLVWGVESLKIYYNSENRNKRFASLFMKITGLCIIAGILLSVFARNLVTIFATEEYMKSAIVISVIALSNILYIMYYFHTFYFMIIKKTYILTFIVAFAAAVNIVLNITLLRHFDYRIVSVTNLFSTLLIYLGILRATAKELSFSHNYGKISFGLICFASAAGIGLIENIAFPMAVKSSVCILLIFVTMKTFGIDSVVYPILRRIRISKR